MSHDDLQKWIDASVKATKLKFMLEDILTKEFSNEEKQSIKYKQLLDTIDQYLEHVMGEYRKNKDEKIKENFIGKIDQLEKTNEKLKKDNDKLKKNSSFFNLKNASIAGVGAIILELAKLIFTFIKGG
jgi:hypothetical protein